MGALILATVYMLLHLSRVRDPSSSRASSRGHALHIREMCYVVREDIYYAWGTCVPPRNVTSMKTYNEISPACRKFPRNIGYLQIVRRLGDGRARLSSTFASNLGFSSRPFRCCSHKICNCDCLRIGAGSEQAKLLFAEIGLNYSVDCASARSLRAPEVSNFLLPVHTEICLPALPVVWTYFRLTPVNYATLCRIHLFSTRMNVDVRRNNELLSYCGQRSALLHTYTYIYVWNMWTVHLHIRVKL